MLHRFYPLYFFQEMNKPSIPWQSLRLKRGLFGVFLVEILGYFGFITFNYSLFRLYEGSEWYQKWLDDQIKDKERIEEFLSLSKYKDMNILKEMSEF